ncbi:hypothetical protein D9619_004841 [Psilocybe cf. subviscida]|uniref:Major facilitator superfamily (MFS) profile domain-containing protein n=1 Tax=Psilocybe cf. subviscida TaxID=2480587 RepID=A0A8H5F8L4_9AGAR|nr:hypothetical protein D9619_004841 [Psilocybe cf. subviscida]
MLAPSYSFGFRPFRATRGAFCWCCDYVYGGCFASYVRDYSNFHRFPVYSGIWPVVLSKCLASPPDRAVISDPSGPNHGFVQLFMVLREYLVSMAQALLPLIQIASVWFIPESPRWLISKGLEARAAAVLVKYHARGSDERDPLVVFEMAQIRHALRMEEETNRQTSYKSLFTVPGNRRRMRLILAIAVFSQWSGNGLVSYYINLVLDGVGIDNDNTKAIINGCLQIFNFVIAATAAMLIDVVGRRPLFLISNGGMFISFSMWTITTALYNAMGNIDAAKATIPLIFVFYFFYDLAYTPLLVAYALEILPFRVRAKGFAVMNFTIMATVAFNQFVNPWALDSISWWYYIFYCGWLIIELVFIYFFIVETKGRTLEETAALFDGEQNSGDLQDFGGQAAAMSEKLVRRADIQTAPRNDDSDSEQYEMLDKKQSRAGSSSTSTV